jgi:hypothetical protein
MSELTLSDKLFFSAGIVGGFMFFIKLGYDTCKYIFTVDDKEFERLCEEEFAKKKNRERLIKVLESIDKTLKKSLDVSNDKFNKLLELDKIR